jgi:hypothetical protein
MSAMSGSAVTPPKGRATRARNDRVRGRSFISPKLQWALVIVAVLLVFAAIFYFGRDVKSDLNGAEVPMGPTDTAVVGSARDV